jgi:primosomal protein N' (replication factor Y) (superfamily II helicase)
VTDPVLPPLVASVAVDVPLPHLDRVFDYAVPAELDEVARPGVRVRVRLAGRLVGGMILARTDGSSFTGKLQPIQKVLGSERVLSAEIAGLCRAVADRWAGTFSDVLRLAVPPRHATVEKELVAEPQPLPSAPDPVGWSRYVHGVAFLEHLAKNGPVGAEPGPRATWAVLPGSDWPAELAAAAQSTLSAGRGVVIVVPDARDSARVAAALTSAIGAERFVELSADLGPAKRYRRFLQLSRGQVKVVVGTRAAAYAPVGDLGLVAVWDDGSDLHDELHAPYANVRDVLVLRAHLAGAGALIGGYAPSVEAVTLLQTGWAQPIAAAREVVRAAAPRVEIAGSEAQLARDPQARAARLPDLAFAAVRGALAAGFPALVSVPRRGYRPAIACARCRTPLRCPVCSGPLAQEADSEVLTCRWCAKVQRDLECPECGSHERRAMVIGDARTADELGRAFPGVPVIRSSGAGIVDAVRGEPALVVATPGAEPVAAGGYGAVLLLDAWALLGRADLRAGEEALRRWMDAAALARPAAEGGQVVLVGASSGLTPVQALVRWDPLGYARFEAGSRAELGFPPASRMAALDATSDQLEAFLAAAQLPADAELLGPVPLTGEAERLIVRVPRAEGAALAGALQSVSRLRSVKSEPVVRVRLDPAAIG